MFGFFEKKEAHVDEVKAPAFVEWKGWRKFKVMNRKQECVDTTTFTLMPADEQPLPAFRAGQGVALRLEGFEPRAYTLCSTPDEGCYRITIKVLDNDRGALSAQLAQCLHVGDEIEVSEPAGGFVLDDRETPVVMIAEGIGITPMVAMLSEIATDHPLRRVHLIYSTKNGEHFPLQEETKNLIKLIPDSGMAVGYTEPRFDEHVGQADARHAASRLHGRRKRRLSLRLRNLRRVRAQHHPAVPHDSRRSHPHPGVRAHPLI